MSLLLACLLLASAARAQDVSSFTAADYVRQALESAPDVRQAEESLRAAQAAYDQELAAAALPTLSFSTRHYPYGYNPANGSAFNGLRLDRGPVLLTTGLNWNLFNSFQDRRRARAARLARESARAALDAARQDRAFSALRAYYDLSAKDRLLAVAERNLRAQQEQYEQTLNLYRHGFKSLADLLKSETDRASSELRRVRAQANHKTSLMAFNLLLDRPAEAAARIADDLEAGAAELPRAGEDLGRALAARPEIARARRDLERAVVARGQALQGLLPSLSADAAWSRQDLAGIGGSLGSPNPNYQVGLSLSLPLNFNLLGQAYAYAGARADARRAQAALDAAARQVREELYSAYIDLERAALAFEIAGRKEDLARRNLDLVLDQYKTGSADVIRLAQAQTDLLDAQVERTGDLHEILIGRARYRRAAGVPLW